MSSRAGRLRIIAGTHRGRLIEVPPDGHTRPTGDRIRESLFSILESGRNDLPQLRGARVLDAFAGSGALGLEALSRGAGHTTFFDTERPAIATVRANVTALGLDERVDIRRADASRPPPAGGRPCDIVFLDPPYDSGMTVRAAEALAEAGWVARNGIVAVETRRGAAFAVPARYTLSDSRTYGDTRLILITFSG